MTATQYVIGGVCTIALLYRDLVHVQLAMTARRRGLYVPEGTVLCMSPHQNRRELWKGMTGLLFCIGIAWPLVLVCWAIGRVVAGIRGRR